MGSLLADYLLRKLHDVEIALADLESCAGTLEERTELQRLEALREQLRQQLRVVVGETPARFAAQRIPA